MISIQSAYSVFLLPYAIYSRCVRVSTNERERERERVEREREEESGERVREKGCPF